MFILYFISKNRQASRLALNSKRQSAVFKEANAMDRPVPDTMMVALVERWALRAHGCTCVSVGEQMFWSSLCIVLCVSVCFLYTHACLGCISAVSLLKFSLQPWSDGQT